MNIDISVVIDIMELLSAWAIAIWLSPNIKRHFKPMLKPEKATKKNVKRDMKMSITSERLRLLILYIVLLSLLVLLYFEINSPEELTRQSVYKIVLYVGAFFFLLLQSSISRVVETVYGMKSADLKLVKSFLNEMKK